MALKNRIDIIKIINYISVFGIILLLVGVCYVIGFGISGVLKTAITPKPPANLTPLIPPSYPPNYPLNMDVTAYIGGPELDDEFVASELKDKLISVCSKVTYNEIDKNFVYNYKISTVSKEPYFLSWEILDRVLNNSKLLDNNSNLLPKMVQLSPEKTLEFSLVSSLPPALYEGQAWIYKQKDNHWELIPLKAQPGPLPRQE